MIRFRVAVAFLLFLTAPMWAVGQSAPVRPRHVFLPQEPSPNLGVLKTRLLAYHDCTRRDCYVPTLDRQANVAIASLRRRVAHAQPGERLALVLDIDETSLSNWDEEKADDFGYIVKDFDVWTESSHAPAIPGTLRVYNEAVSDGVVVFFITGRPEAQRTATVKNLKAVGYMDWAGLALRGTHLKSETTTQYKSAERRKIVNAGYTIILNIGDQMSDLNGEPQAEYSVKLPNPFYYIP
jgi:acid phosphatase